MRGCGRSRTHVHEGSLRIHLGFYEGLGERGSPLCVSTFTPLVNVVHPSGERSSPRTTFTR
jgi:hypothetical protein